MPPEQRLRIGAQPRSGRLEAGNRLSPPHDGEVLASVLDRVEDVGEVSGCFGRAHLGHEIRLSDMPTDVAEIGPPTGLRVRSRRREAQRPLRANDRQPRPRSDGQRAERRTEQAVRRPQRHGVVPRRTGARVTTSRRWRAIAVRRHYLTGCRVEPGQRDRHVASGVSRDSVAHSRSATACDNFPTTRGHDAPPRRAVQRNRRLPARRERWHGHRRRYTSARCSTRTTTTRCSSSSNR